MILIGQFWLYIQHWRFAGVILSIECYHGFIIKNCLCEEIHSGSGFSLCGIGIPICSEFEISIFFYGVVCSLPSIKGKCSTTTLKKALEDQWTWILSKEC